MWEARNFKRDFELMSLEFLFLDAQDCLIQVSIPHQHIHLFQDRIREGDVFLINNFDVIRSGARFKLTDHKFMIRFTPSTTIDQLDLNVPTIQLEKFRFRNPKELWSLADKNEQLPDVIAFLEDPMPNPYVSYGSTPRKLVLHLVLEDSTKARMSIWDSLVMVFLDQLRQANEKNIVIVVTSINPKKFGVHLYLNTTSATKFYLNAEFPAIKEFRNRVKFDPPSVELYRDVETSVPNNPSHRISDILDFLSSEKQQDKEFTCMATITDVVLRNGWSYIACSDCGRKLLKLTTSLSCSNCANDKAVGNVRYRIEVVVDDDTDRTNFVIFDRDARKLLNKAASDLINAEDCSVETNRDMDDPPEIVRSLIGRRLTFQIKVTPYNFRARYQSFTVSRILDTCSDSLPEEKPQKGQLLDLTTTKDSNEPIANKISNDSTIQGDANKTAILIGEDVEENEESLDSIKHNPRKEIKQEDMSCYERYDGLENSRTKRQKL